MIKWLPFPWWHIGNCESSADSGNVSEVCMLLKSVFLSVRSKLLALLFFSIKLTSWLSTLSLRARILTPTHSQIYLGLPACSLSVFRTIILLCFPSSFPLLIKMSLSLQRICVCVCVWWQFRMLSHPLRRDNTADKHEPKSFHFSLFHLDQTCLVHRQFYKYSLFK